MERRGEIGRAKCLIELIGSCGMYRERGECVKVGEEDQRLVKWSVVNCVMSAMSVEGGVDRSSDVWSSEILVLDRCVRKRW